MFIHSSAKKLIFHRSHSLHNHVFFLRANAFAERLRLGLAVIHGEPKDMVDTEDDDGRNSPPPDEGPKESSGTPSKSGRVETNYTRCSVLKCWTHKFIT